MEALNVINVFNVIDTFVTLKHISLQYQLSEKRPL